MRGADSEADYQNGRLVRWLRGRLPSTEDYAGSHLTIKQDGRRLLTPMAIVIVALGTTDLLFALDSIPAIYGLTKQPYLVLTANLFALMGLRQLYFLIGGLLQRLVYLSVGLSVLLAFIGVKLVLHALHENSLPFINSGRSVGWAPDIPIWLSMVVILGVLAITTLASLARSASKPDLRPLRPVPVAGQTGSSGRPGPAGGRAVNLVPGRTVPSTRTTAITPASRIKLPSAACASTALSRPGCNPSS